jgi:hypothetical protein
MTDQSNQTALVQRTGARLSVARLGFPPPRHLSCICVPDETNLKPSSDCLCHVEIDLSGIQERRTLRLSTI